MFSAISEFWVMRQQFLALLSSSTSHRSFGSSSMRTFLIFIFLCRCPQKNSLFSSYSELTVEMMWLITLPTFSSRSSILLNKRPKLTLSKSFARIVSAFSFSIVIQPSTDVLLASQFIFWACIAFTMLFALSSVNNKPADIRFFLCWDFGSSWSIRERNTLSVSLLSSFFLFSSTSFIFFVFPRRFLIHVLFLCLFLSLSISLWVLS